MVEGALIVPAGEEDVGETRFRIVGSGHREESEGVAGQWCETVEKDDAQRAAKDQVAADVDGIVVHPAVVAADFDEQDSDILQDEIAFDGEEAGGIAGTELPRVGQIAGDGGAPEKAVPSAMVNVPLALGGSPPPMPPKARSLLLVHWEPSPVTRGVPVEPLAKPR